MTAAALVRRSDLKRMAEIAKAEGVRVEIEVDGKIIRVSPDIPENHKQQRVDMKPEDFTSLADWQAWRDQERAREAQRHS
ncbi:hypothetical protein ACC808_10785 [Rhizobium ruizarguesonis]|jgi:hypothetical protein|uniref:hypothetical protein n=1 Tax=Rhizobium leguminosarum TaxID=384 RepID=UPI001030436C|nr:hypothetical protein [Rhizobium leguminosarum]TBY90469.1 hypothetical protein E0H40_12840 [Rhizobium leguminosarum bv. viciae]TAV48396.1 hypothetical protein ELI32_09280 [Rhizobium leguminosarum]TAV57896.1 hypothetical protein ELI31_08810 [Rhizobium leguminosarum]TAV68836.1 hypothetical protein ELI30_08825 [Rhizobium leguminosarum]TAV89269.1 hypothetical protein ELI22_08610 [Rhizobium leguminosarum]